MSVYKDKRSRFFQYDFVYKRVRYTGSTKVLTKRKAEQVEQKIRDQLALGIDPNAEMTLDEAVGRWWIEVGQHKASATILKYRAGVMMRLIGPNTSLTSINTGTISIAIERRRGETYARTKTKGAKQYQLANATVNSDVIKRARAVLNRARDVWNVKGLQVIDWKKLRLEEPETAIVHFEDAYLQKWSDACGPTERFALRLLAQYGPRFSELFFPPEAFLPATPNGPGLALNKRKKGITFLPLTLEDARMIAARVGVAEAAGFKTIWVERDTKGDLVEVSYAALQSRLRVAAERAGVDHTRLIHSIRHHVGTDVLNSTGDIAKTQRMLGHADVRSTKVYAHVLDQGLRDVINSRSSPGAPELEGEFVVPDQPRKRR